MGVKPSLVLDARGQDALSDETRGVLTSMLSHFGALLTKAISRP